MTKEIDFLSISKSTGVKTDTKANTKVEKKEGLSLFDSLMVNNQKNKISKENTDTVTKSDVSTLKKEEGISKSSKENIEEKSTDTKPEKKESTKVNSNSKIIEKPEIKEANLSEKDYSATNETKIEKQSSATSLLDRMIIEAKKNVKTIDSEKSILVNKEEVEVNPRINENKSNEKPVKNISLLDKMISQAKTVISEDLQSDKIVKEIVVDKTIVDSQKNTDTKSSITADSKIEEKDITTKENSNKDTSLELKDNSKLEKDLSESKNIENKTEKVITETKIDNSIAGIKNDLDSDEKIDNNQKIEIKSDINNFKKENIESSVLATKIEKDIKENIKTEKTPISSEEEIVNKNIKKESLDITDTKKNEKDIKENIKTEKTPINSEEEIVNKNIKKESLDITDTKKIEKIFNGNVEDKIVNKSIGNEKTTNLTKNLSTLVPEAIVKDEEIVNIDKKELLKDSPKESSSSNSKSLMDRLLSNAKNTIISPKEIGAEQSLEGQKSNLKTNDVVTNIFLSSQKNSIYNQMLSTKQEGTEVVQKGKSLDDIKKGAKILDLGLKKTSIDVTSANKNLKVNDTMNTDALLDKLAFSKNIKNDSLMTSTSSNSTSSGTTSSTIENTVNLNVNPSLALSIQNRIIGAQQNMTSMLSDVARNMYENYKPPVTAFRINLFPSQLGHIAILMKNDKENGISISMNMSSSSTLDSFLENQNILKEALNKNFNNNETTFDLDFNLQDQNPNQSDQQNQNKENKENHSSTDILETITQNQNVGEDLNYL